MLASEPALIERYTALGWWGVDTLDAHFLRNVAAHPQRLAVIDPPNRLCLIGSEPKQLTYAELAEQVDAFAAQLNHAGVCRGDILVIQLPNVYELIVILLACARTGVVASPVVMQFDKAELGEIFSQLKPTAYMTLSRLKERQMAGKMKALCANFDVILLNIDDLPAVPVAADAPAKTSNFVPTAANEVLTICWTSGTEGQAKGVMRSHNLWCSIGRMVGWAARLEKGDVILNARPMVNMAAIGGSFYSWLAAAGTLVLHHPLDMMMVLDQIREQRVTLTFMPPAFLVALLKDPALRLRADLSSLRIMGSGSAAIPSWAVLQMEADFNVEIVNFFGSNEGVSLQGTAATVPDAKLRATHFARVGTPNITFPELEASCEIETKLVDVDSGEEIVEPGRPGELLIRGSTIFSWYVNAPAETSAAFDSDGFYRSGDLFEIAGNGDSLCYYKFVGRCREVIIRGGFNIAPAEIDDLLSDHPHILEVAAFSVPDERLGERAGIAVVLKHGMTITLEDVVQHLREKHIATYKLPERLLFVDSLPRNAMQKVLRAQLSTLFNANSQHDTQEALIE